MERNVEIAEDVNGKKIVFIKDIRFRGKRKIEWEHVEKYLKEYVNQCYEIVETADKIYIGSDFPAEYAGSLDTVRLRGAQAKAKANAAQGIPELLQIVIGKRYKENKAEKHEKNAMHGWYRYTSRFALPIYNEEDKVEKYNIFRIEMLIRHAADGKMYLYDAVNIKKKRAPRMSKNCTVTNPFLLI